MPSPRTPILNLAPPSKLIRFPTMQSTIVTQPASEPVSVDAMLQFLGYGPAAAIDATTLAALTGRLQPLITAARIACENWSRSAYVNQTWKLQADGFQIPLTLPRTPFKSITSFQYLDSSAMPQTLAVDNSYGVSVSGYAYQLNPGTETLPATLWPAYQTFWPQTRRVPNAVTVIYQCGFDSVPESICLGVKFMTKYFYEGGAIEENAPLPSVVTDLLGFYRNLFV